MQSDVPLTEEDRSAVSHPDDDGHDGEQGCSNDEYDGGNGDVDQPLHRPPPRCATHRGDVQDRLVGQHTRGHRRRAETRNSDVDDDVAIGASRVAMDLLDLLFGDGVGGDDHSCRPRPLDGRRGAGEVCQPQVLASDGT